MKTLTKILSVTAVLVTTASAGSLNLTKGLNIGIEKGLQDKQNVTVVNVNKTILSYVTINVNVSNKTYKDYSVSFNLDNFKLENGGIIGVSSIYGYETFNGRTTENVTQKVQTTDKYGEPVTKEVTTTKDIDEKRHQIYIGASGTYVVNKNLNLYNEIDVGTKAVTLKLGLQHCFTNHISAGAEISKRWSYNSDYDDTNNVLFNISYTF